MLQFAFSCRQNYEIEVMLILLFQSPSGDSHHVPPIWSIFTFSLWHQPRTMPVGVLQEIWLASHLKRVQVTNSHRREPQTSRLSCPDVGDIDL